MIGSWFQRCWRYVETSKTLIQSWFFQRPKNISSLTVVYEYDIKLLFNYSLMAWIQLKNRYIAVRCCDVIPLYKLFSYVPVLFTTTKILQGPLLVSAPRTTEWRHEHVGTGKNVGRAPESGVLTWLTLLWIYSKTTEFIFLKCILA